LLPILEAAQQRGAHETGADPDDHVAAPFVEDLVDHRGHDPRREGGGARNDQQAGDGNDIGPAVFLAVFGQDTAQHRADLGGLDLQFEGRLDSQIRGASWFSACRMGRISASS
jgi:hypothetical protein